MHKIKLALDFDDVMYQTSSLIIEEVNKKFNLNIRLQDLNNNFFLEEVLKGYSKDIEDIKRYVHDLIITSYEIEKELYLEDNLCWLSYIQVIDNVVEVITNRKENSIQATESLLNNLYDKIDINFNLYMIGSQDYSFSNLPAKDIILNETNAEVFIEDRADTIETVLKNTNCKVLIYDKPWNRSLKEDNKRSYRVFNWNQISSKILTFFLQKNNLTLSRYAKYFEERG